MAHSDYDRQMREARAREFMLTLDGLHLYEWHSDTWMEIFIFACGYGP